MKQILIVEDDRNLNQGIYLALRNEYICVQTDTLEAARGVFDDDQPDLILLDVNLPDGDGITFLTEIRKISQIPIILLTVNKMEMDIVTGLELGANDYITKPFSLMVLRARVRACLRDSKGTDQIYTCGDFYFDFNRMEFMIGKESVELSKTEQRLRCCLVENRGRYVTRNQLIDTVWQGETEFVDAHALTVAVNRLRKKLKDQSEKPRYIKTVYGIGYTWTVS